MAQSIKFTANGWCSNVGNFSDGDIARNLPDALAAHLVNEARCAEYLQAPAPAAPAAEDAKPAEKPKRPRKPATTQADEPKDD
jgi:hypothetical protein